MGSVKENKERTQMVSANVWPHDHNYAQGGPIDIRLGTRSQPDLVKGWNWKDKKGFPLFHLDQPCDDNNFTLCRLFFLKKGAQMPGELVGFPWHRATMCRMLGSGAIELRVKVRYIKTLPHPVPLGSWKGTMIEDAGGQWVLYTLQHKTLDVATHKQPEEERTILLPGDEDFNVPTPDSQIVIP